MLYGQIIYHSQNPSVIGSTVTFTDETGVALTGTIESDGYCRKKLPAFKVYTASCGAFESDLIALGCGENRYVSDDIEQLVTIYSAKGDTVSFTDVNGNAQVVAFGSDETSATILIKTASSGYDITFTSAIAKDPSDLTAYYSKTITVDGNTSDIYVMPENTLYWWGYSITNSFVHQRYVENESAGAWAGDTNNRYSSMTAPSGGRRYATECINMPITSTTDKEVKWLMSLDNSTFSLETHAVPSNDPTYYGYTHCSKNGKDNQYLTWAGVTWSSDPNTNASADEYVLQANGASHTYRMHALYIE